jgi:hypothetical protein
VDGFEASGGLDCSLLPVSILCNSDAPSFSGGSYDGCSLSVRGTRGKEHERADEKDIRSVQRAEGAEARPRGRHTKRNKERAMHKDVPRQTANKSAWQAQYTLECHGGCTEATFANTTSQTTQVRQCREVLVTSRTSASRSKRMPK